MDEERVVPVWRFSDGELTAALLHAQSVLSQGYGRMLTLVAEADGRGLAAGKGYRDTATFLAGVLRLSTREAKARVAHASTSLPLTGVALAVGRSPWSMSPRSIGSCPAHRSRWMRRSGCMPSGRWWSLRSRRRRCRCGRPGTGCWPTGDADSAKPKDTEGRLAEPRRRFRYWFAADGQMHFTGELDPETATLLTGVMTPLAKPRPVDEFGQEDTRTTAQRHGDALAETVALATRAPDLPTVGGERAVVMVTVTLEELERRAGSAFLGGIGYSSISHLRRLCCDAKVIPAVLGTRGEVLDLGRARRLASPVQCRALALRDRGCARPGCHRSPRHCQAHHVREWVDGGPTDIDNLALLCDFHHRQLHHTGWSMRIIDGVPEFLPPKWLDREQKPIRNTTHNLPHEHAA